MADWRPSSGYRTLAILLFHCAWPCRSAIRSLLFSTLSVHFTHTRILSVHAYLLCGERRIPARDEHQRSFHEYVRYHWLREVGADLRKLGKEISEYLYRKYRRRISEGTTESVNLRKKGTKSFGISWWTTVPSTGTWVSVRSLSTVVSGPGRASLMSPVVLGSALVHVQYNRFHSFHCWWPRRRTGRGEDTLDRTRA